MRISLFFLQNRLASTNYGNTNIPDLPHFRQRSMIFSRNPKHSPNFAKILTVKKNNCTIVCGTVQKLESQREEPGSTQKILQDCPFAAKIGLFQPRIGLPKFGQPTTKVTPKTLRVRWVHLEISRSMHLGPIFHLSDLTQ